MTKSNLWLVELDSGAMTPIGDHRKTISYNEARFAPDGTLWVTSDENSDFLRLGTLDIPTGKFTPKAPEPRWDVETFDISEDGRFIAYAINDAGRSVLRLLDVATGTARTVPMPAGTIGGLEIAPWGEIGLTFTSAKSPADAFSVDPVSMAVTRWTHSETGGLDPAVNAEPEQIEVKSFDGLPISGFLYRPDTQKFAGPRPLIMNIHGGPESQSRPGFLGRSNYLLNELGIAIFYPNVRGSTGYGKAFVEPRQWTVQARGLGQGHRGVSRRPVEGPATRREPLRRHGRLVRRLHVLRERDVLRAACAAPTAWSRSRTS